MEEAKQGSKGRGKPWVPWQQLLMLPPPAAQTGEITMLGEITHLQGIMEDLVVLTAEPHKLPPTSEQVRSTRTGCAGGGRECKGGMGMFGGEYFWEERQQHVSTGSREQLAPTALTQMSIEV